MKRLVLVRHGQTEWNRIGRVQGTTDVALDDTGHAQARAVAPSLAAYRPAALWCSDLSRAATTASYVGEACGLTPLPDARLREWGFGEREGLTHAEFEAADPQAYAAFRIGRYDEVPDAERAADVRSRFVEALRELLDATDDGACSIAVAHGAAIKLGVGALLGWSDRQAVDSLWGMHNCGWAELTFTAGLPARLVAYNRVTPIS
ncbi:histidine phosphatase family protein [Nocardioides sp. AN3]